MRNDFSHPLADVRDAVHVGMMSASKLIGYIALVVVPLGWIYIVLTGETRLQIGIANGVYANRCCGALVLKNGTMMLANQRIKYVIEQDKVGPYILPERYVGASNGGFVIKSSGHPLILRLDDAERPHQIQLVGDQPNGAAYSFLR